MKLRERRSLNRKKTSKSTLSLHECHPPWGTHSNRRALEQFMNPSNFSNWIIAVRNGDMINLNIELPPISVFKQKACVILKAHVNNDLALENENIANEVIVMEFTKSVLENLSLLCQVSAKILFKFVRISISLLFPTHSTRSAGQTWSPRT